jgi:hypothetical protein
MTDQAAVPGSLTSRLWRGEVPLAIAFWRYGMLWGTLINVLATIATLALVAEGAPLAAWLAVHFLPLPYNFLVVVGVWRARDTESWAQATIAIWATFLTFA